MDDNERQIELAKLANEKTDKADDRKFRLVFTGILGTTLAFLGIVVPAVVQGLQLWVNRDKALQDVELQKVRDQGTLAQGYIALVIGNDRSDPDKMLLLAALSQLDGHPLQKWAQRRYDDYQTGVANVLAAQAAHTKAAQMKNGAERDKSLLETHLQGLNAQQDLDLKKNDIAAAEQLQPQIDATWAEIGQLAAAIAASTASETGYRAFIDQAANVPPETITTPPVDAAQAITGLASRINSDLLMSVFAASAKDRIQQNARFLAAATQEFAVTDDRVVAAIIAAIAVESPTFESVDEKPSAANTSAQPFDRYDNRFGNTLPGDGNKYHGRGYIQLTGKTLYQQMSDRLSLGTHLLDTPADANRPELAARIAVAFFADRLPIITADLDGGDLAAVNRIVSGGLVGVDQFTKAYNTVLTKLRAPAQLPPPQTYTVYLHYRDDKAHSRDFKDAAKKLLTAQGFKVPDPSKEGLGERVGDAPQGNAEGPHVDYFVSSPGDAGGLQGQAIASQIVDILNNAPQKPAELSAFTVLPPRILPNQVHSIGVWF